MKLGAERLWNELGLKDSNLNFLLSVKATWRRGYDNSTRYLKGSALRPQLNLVLEGQ